MARRRKLTLGLSGLAMAGAALILLSPLAGATSPPFVATPSYAPYGGLHFDGSKVLAATGSGYTKVVVVPTFKVSTGVVREAVRSVANASAVYGIGAHAGLENLSFGCPASSCSSGSYNVTINGTGAWGAILNSTCPGTATHPSVVANVTVAVVAEVLDQSTVPVSKVGNHTAIAYHHELFGKGKVTAGMTKIPFNIIFSASLTSGSSYTVQFWFLVSTWAAGVTPIGTACTSWASASIGTTGTTVVHWVGVA